MKLSDERLAEFNGRMNDWISKQGLLFQLTHGGTGLGGRPPIVGSIVRAIVSLSLLLLLSSLAYGGFLFWKATGDELPKQFRLGIAGALGVEKVTAAGFERDLSMASYKQIMAEGDEDTFFNSIEARGIEFPMEPRNGLFGDWDAKSLTINELKVALKAGEADDERAHKSWESFFYNKPSFSFSKVEVSRASVTWGYSTPATWGGIIDSTLVANRTEDGWNLKFSGGSFSQGIFRDFTIEEIKVEIGQEEGFQITEAKLQKEGGNLTWNCQMTEGGASPQFEIEGQFSQLSLDGFLPRGLLSTLNGSISGTFEGSGSTNDSDGIRFRILARPEGKTGIHLTKELTLLRMLSHLDPQRSYRKVPFNQGEFELATKGSELTFSKINLSSFDEDLSRKVAQLKGSFTARPATIEDLKNDSLAFEDTVDNTSATIGATTDLQVTADDGNRLGEEILRQFRTLQFENPHRELFFFKTDSEGKELLKKRLELTPRRKFRYPFIVEGQLELAVPETAFANSIELPQVKESGDDSDLRWIEIDLRDLILQSTKRLSDKWEQAMEEAGEDF